jgi:rSAM/selenodomain-associated transferase 2
VPASPELSIIIPLLNEAGRIETTLRMLARQEGIDFEVILSDGFSTDDTLARAAALRQSLPFELTIVTGGRGRGRQLNRGTAVAGGRWLLFLHADSVFPDSAALRKGVTSLAAAAQARGEGRTAGRFTLRFDREGTDAGFGYFFCEGKARLNRDGCILGDQGFLLPRKLLERVGPLDESLPLAEDLEFALRIRRSGEFLLLPAEIITSSRRFRREGYRPRQTLNALLMGLLFSGQTFPAAIAVTTSAND